jgi:hypothetical protein
LTNPQTSSGNPDPVSAPPVDVEIGASLLARTWRSAAREFALIVAGVLTALAAQAWWEARQEREREAAYSVQLVADAQETERRLEAALASERLAEISTRWLAEALQSEGPLLEDSIRAWLTPPRWIFWYSDPRPVLGTVASLLQTGDLRLLRKDAVRRATSAYANEINGEQIEFSRWVEQDIDALSAFETLGSRLVDEFPFTKTPEDTGMRGAIFITALRNSPEIRSLLLTTETARRNRVFYLERMRDATIRYRASLEGTQAQIP